MEQEGNTRQERGDRKKRNQAETKRGIEKRECSRTELPECGDAIYSDRPTEDSFNKTYSFIHSFIHPSYLPLPLSLSLSLSLSPTYSLYLSL